MECEHYWVAISVGGERLARVNEMTDDDVCCLEDNYRAFCRKCHLLMDLYTITI